MITRRRWSKEQPERCASISTSQKVGHAMTGNNLPALTVTRKSGDEMFHQDAAPLGFDLLDFWRWSASDLASNALRGVLAEYIVAQALGVAEVPRSEWEPFDLMGPGGAKVEIKSSAYLQTWAQRSYSKITFGIAPTRAWDADTGDYSGTIKRQSDVYVFALLAHRDQESLDPLDLAQWEFYVMATSVLDEKVPIQKTVSLKGLMDLGCRKGRFDEIKAMVDEVCFDG